MKKQKMAALITCILVVGLAGVWHCVVQKSQVKESIKVGFVYIGDESNPYVYNFIRAQKSIENQFGDKVQVVEKFNVPENAVEEPLVELAKEKCDVIFATSYGYGKTTKEVAKKYPEIQFCQATGDNANQNPIVSNYHTYMGAVYQGRYIAGIVAGMKLQEMISEGKITPQDAKIGYVGAYAYAEVISGYTSFYLGVRSVVPEAVMTVKYTNTWSSYSTEKQAAKELVDEDCVVISQHSDTVGPAAICENAQRDIPVYHVGYNQSMTDIAPTRSLVSCCVDYSSYFEQSVYALLHDKKIEECIDGRTYKQDAMAGIDKGWVRILDINEAIVPKGTKEMVEDTIEKIEKGKLEVFSGPFTGVSVFDRNDKINLNTPYKENANSSSPSFSYVLDDVITIEKMKEE